MEKKKKSREGKVHRPAQTLKDLSALLTDLSTLGTINIPEH